MQLYITSSRAIIHYIILRRIQPVEGFGKDGSLEDVHTKSLQNEINRVGSADLELAFTEKVNYANHSLEDNVQM
jgi:hypothetical protein